jgi:hypothetical protein
MADSMRRSPMRRLGIVAAVLVLALSPVAASADSPNTVTGCWQRFAAPAQPQISDIAHGPDGSLWATLWVPQQGVRVGRWNGNGWTTFGGIYGVFSLAITPAGQPWMVTGDQNIYRLVGDNWEQVPGQAYFLDIGHNGAIWKVGPELIDYGYSLSQWNGTGWTPVDVPRPYAPLGVTVDRFGNPWVNSSEKLYRRIPGAGWEEVNASPGYTFKIDIGGSDSPLYGEQMWRIIWNQPQTDWPIQRWNRGIWTNVEGAGRDISVDREGRPWHLNSWGDVFFWGCP